MGAMKPSVKTGKWQNYSPVREKSGNFEMEIDWQPCMKGCAK